MYVRADTGLTGAVRAEAPCLFAMSLQGELSAVKNQIHLAAGVVVKGNMFMLLTQRFTHKQRSGFWATCRANLCMTFQRYREPRVVHTADTVSNEISPLRRNRCGKCTALSAALLCKNSACGRMSRAPSRCNLQVGKQQAASSLALLPRLSDLVVGVAGSLVAACLSRLSRD